MNRRIEIAPLGSNDFVDITQYLDQGGLKWSRNDVEVTNAVRTQDSLTHRGKIAGKIRLDVTCRYLSDTEASIVLTAISPEYVQVRYHDPQTGSTVVRVMFSNNSPAVFAFDKGDHIVWGGITFPLEER